MTDFREWLKQNVDPHESDELYHLYLTLDNFSDTGEFRITPGHEAEDERQLLTGPSSALEIPSEEVRHKMLRYLSDEHMDGMDGDTWWDFLKRKNEDG